MTTDNSLKLSGISYAVCWTVAMLWWTGPQGVAGYVIFPVAGAIGGVLWYGVMKKWHAWTVARANKLAA